MTNPPDDRTQIERAIIVPDIAKETPQDPVSRPGHLRTFGRFELVVSCLVFSLALVSATFAAAPTAPTNLSASTVSQTQINLAWVDNSAGGSDREDGFKIERAATVSGPWTLIATTVENANTYSSTGLSASTSYSYRVLAFSATKGSSGYTNTASATTQAAPPAAPTALLVTAASPSQINLTWTDHSNNEWGFKIERATALPGPYKNVALVTTNVTSFSNTGLNASSTYFYRVYAFNGVSRSLNTNFASATTRVSTTVPIAPTNLTATAVSSSQINLTWIDGATDETGFTVERGSSSSGPFSQIATVATTSAVGASLISYSSTGLSPSTTYYYRARSYNAIGSSTYSGTASAATLAGAGLPAAPSGLSATVTSSSQINLTWIDNAGNESGFKIERAASSGGPWTQSALLGANVTGYSSTGLSASTAYYYRARASSATGDSGYSNVASATTSAAVATGGAELWSGRFGGTVGGSDLTDPRSIAKDAAANVYTAGNFYGVADFGNGVSITSGGGYDGFVAKVSSTGTAVWAKRLGGSLSDYAYSVATDSTGNVIVAGEFQGTADFGCGPLSNPAGNSLNAYVVKLSAANGACLWSKNYGGTYRDTANGVATDGSGNILVTGAFYDTVSFGGVSLTAHFSLNAAPDIFVLKLGSDGHTVWAKGGFGDSSDDIGRSVAVDAGGNVLVTGEFVFSADFGSPTGVLTNPEYPDVFVVKFDSSGNPLWARQYGGSLDQRGTDIAVDAASNVLVTGWFRGSINLGGGSVTVPAGSSGLFLAKLTPAGGYMWQKTALDSDYLRYPSVAVDAGSNVLMTSSIRQNVDLGGGALTTANVTLQDAFVVKYRTDGSYVWARRFRGTNESMGADVVSPDGSNLVYIGWLSGTIDFGGGPVVNGTNGVRAGFVIELGP